MKLAMSAVLAGAIGATLLAGCAVTRVDPPPAVEAPARYREDGPWKQAAATDAAVPDAWWSLFGDATLDELQRRLVVGNQNLKAAVAQVASARATLDASRSAPYPTLSAGLDAVRSGGATASSATASSAARAPSNVLSLSASASWEVDLWGRLAEATRGAQAQLQASVDDLAAARLSAQATLVQLYVSLRAADAQAALLERSVRGYERSLELTRDRYAGGVAARTDVLQAETQLRSAQAQWADTLAQRGQSEHAIAVLLGVPPSDLRLAPDPTALPRPPAVPPMLPSTLLERRPDIAAAERRVAAAYAQVGIADAAWFPSLTLSAGAGYRASTLNGLVGAPNLFWSLGPALAQTILDGGQRRLASAQARAAADQATAVYRQAVLTALQEVEDNLVLATELQREAQLQQEALQSAQRTLQITVDQYRGGTVSYLNVVIAQSAALSSESSFIATRARQLAAINQLLKNIAGRWDAPAAQAGGGG